MSIISIASAQATVVTSASTATLGSVRYYDCAGEYVELQGEYRSVFHVVFDPRGGTHLTFQYNSHGITGRGLQTGTIYRAVERDRSGTTNIFAAPGFEMTTVDIFHLIGQGNAPDLAVEVREHITLNANGEFSVRYTEINSSCR